MTLHIRVSCWKNLSEHCQQPVFQVEAHLERLDASMFRIPRGYITCCGTCKEDNTTTTSTHSESRRRPSLRCDYVTFFGFHHANDESDNQNVWRLEMRPRRNTLLSSE
jgi:hypothetical protein